LICHKKDFKQTLFIGLLIILILISNIQTITQLSVQDNKDDKIDKDNPQNKEEILSPIISDLNVTDYITGSGVNQTVRVYMENNSKSYNNLGYFNITSPSNNMYLSSGDFYFYFENNYTADYILEDDDALYPEEFINFIFNSAENYSDIFYVPNHNYTKVDLSILTDNDQDTSIKLNSSSSGMINFTICANFTDSIYYNPGLDFYVNFSRTMILGLILSLTYNLSASANLTVKMKDSSTLTWKNITNTLEINHTLGIHQINERIINKNLNYIDFSNSCYIQFIFTRTNVSEYFVDVSEFNLESTLAFDLPITNESYVALEFDLKGKRSTVNGFYAWIRTLNLIGANNAELNITLYKADRTIVRTGSNLRNIDMNPNKSEQIYSTTLKYSGDQLTYFKFNNSKTANLSLYNYFIVIKSNVSELIYSLTALPYSQFGDDKTEHQLKTKKKGSSWENAKKRIDTYGSSNYYDSFQLDASGFKINVTRGYMVSDFNVNGTDTLKIQGVPISSWKVSDYPYNESSSLTWGLGKLEDFDFPNPIQNSPQLNFKIDLNWSKAIVKGFKFNVSYVVEAYKMEKALSTYNVTYDEIPMWTFNYTLNLNAIKFKTWNFSKYVYIYPEYFTALNLTKPSGENILSDTSGEKVYLVKPNTEKSNYKQLEIPFEKTKGAKTWGVANVSGSYLLLLNSSNLVYQMHSYINYNGILWETNGFMYGDNISVSLDIQDHQKTAPKNGTAEVVLFYPTPNGTRYPGSVLMSANGVPRMKNKILMYDFENRTILNLTNDLTFFGKYLLGYFWTNGSAIGCKKMIIYIDTYDISISDVVYYPKQKVNILQGTTLNKVLNNYTLLIASVNETTGIHRPNYYYISTEFETKPIFYIITGTGPKWETYFPITLESFKQNETIINPNEKIDFKVAIKNQHPFSDLNVKIKIQLVSLANEEWIISENESDTIVLKTLGNPKDTKEFNVSLSIPKLLPDNIWKGENAPVRKAGAKTLVTFYIEGEETISKEGTSVYHYYESDNYSLIINKTENEFEGQIIALKISEDTTSKSILKGFNRNECIYKPKNTTFIINVYDRYYISSYNQFSKTFSHLKYDSKFMNITISPTELIEGRPFNISSILTTEFGDVLSNKKVTCQYDNDGTWVNISSQNTNVNGSSLFTIDTLTINVQPNMTFRLIWIGDNYILYNSTELEVSIIVQKNNISINWVKEKTFIYRDMNSTITFQIINKGDSVLRILNISISFNKDLEFFIREKNNLLLNDLDPGEKTIIRIEVNLEKYKKDNLNLTIIVTTENKISHEIITFEKTINITILDRELVDYFVIYFMFFIIAFLVLLWIIAITYARKINKKIEGPQVEEEEKRRRPRKGRYIAVSELPPKPPDKTKTTEKMLLEKQKKEKEHEMKRKKSTDLDELLKKKGLADKTKTRKGKK